MQTFKEWKEKEDVEIEKVAGKTVQCINPKNTKFHQKIDKTWRKRKQNFVQIHSEGRYCTPPTAARLAITFTAWIDHNSVMQDRIADLEMSLKQSKVISSD